MSRSVDRRRRREPERPRLEYYQTPDGNLRVEEAKGPTGAWIEIERNGGRP